MTASQQIAGCLRLFRHIGRSAAVALVWLLVVGLGTACFFPPGASFPLRASEDWAAFHNALVFGSSAAVASAVAAALAFAIGGKTKWTYEVVFAVTLTVALLTAVACTCLWLAPWLARSRMGYWEFVRLRDTLLRWSASIVRSEIPLGGVVGLLLGVLAGRLAVLARRHPRIAMGLMLGLLFAGASEPVQRVAFGLVLFWGHVVRWLIWSPGMTYEFVPASGATFGAIAGAIIAVVALWRERTRPSSQGIASAEALGPYPDNGNESVQHRSWGHG
jgi:MFS family permease